LTLRRSNRWIAVPLALVAVVAIWVVRAGRHGSAPRSDAVAEANDLNVQNWTPRFREHIERGAWDALDGDLDVIAHQDPDLYQRYRLAYLHARARIARGNLAAGRQALEPFLAAGDPLRDLALYYAAQAAQAEGKKDEAARLRETLVLEFPKATYWQAALDDLVAYHADKRDAAALADLGRKIAGTVEAPVLRDIESRTFAARLAGGDEAAIPEAFRFLRAGSLADDAAERVAMALDRLEWISRFAAEDLVLIGEAERNARHFDRAIEVLRLPPSPV
jgi:hypothetical protein